MNIRNKLASIKGTVFLYQYDVTNLFLDGRLHDTVVSDKVSCSNLSVSFSFAIEGCPENCTTAVSRK